MRNLLYFLILSTLAANLLFAQKAIKGIVIDGETGEALPAANIQIENTYKGTITNPKGQYTMELETVPATIIITFIGYATERIHITAESEEKQNIAMTPVTYELEAITVTGEDPAVGIMREVIKRKQEWRSKLKTYSADAYTRQQLSNDSGIVSITESTSESFWDHERGSREVIKSKWQTSNVEQENNFAGASYVANFYDDDIEIMGFRVIGPTHPKAISNYHFKLEGRRHLDEKVVFDISVRPKSKLQTAFVGSIAVLDEDFAMIEVDLKPSESMLFPDPIQEWNVAYKQQFSNFGKDFWFPVDVRIDGMIKFGIVGLQFPPIGYNQMSQITNYRVNIELPDSLYGIDRLLIDDTLSIRQQDTLRLATTRVIPLSEEETAAYEEIDSTDTFGKAFQPTGFLARFVDLDDDENNNSGDGKSGIFSEYFSFSPQLWYHRVDGGHFGLKISNASQHRVRYRANAGYKTSLKKWSYGGGLTIKLDKKKRAFLEADYQAGTDPRYRTDNYNLTINSLLPLTGLSDYYDYYWNERFAAKIGYEISGISTKLTAGFRSEKHESVEKTTDYSLINRNNVQRENPAIQDGTLRSLTFSVSAGDDYVPFGLFGQKHASLKIEHSSPDIFSSDFDFTRFDFTFDWRLNTFFNRRILPNSLDFRVVGGTYAGTVPIQRFGIVDASFYSFKPFATFRTLNGNPYEGERYAALFWEHNFRTVPFEILGFRGLAKYGLSFIVFGGHGRTWISDETFSRLTYSPRYLDGFHHEIGASISHLFKLFRIDFAQRLDKPGFYVGFGMTRFF